MKNSNLKFILPAILICSPLGAFAQTKNIVDYMEMSSGMLLTLMLGIIIFLLILLLTLTKSIQTIAGLQKKDLAKKPKSKGSKLLLALVLMNFSLNAQTAEVVNANNAYVLSDTLFWLLIAAIVILSVMNYYFYRSFHSLLKHKREMYSEKKSADPIDAQATPTYAVNDEEALMTDHVYDGIRELDNDLPPWWKYLFYATIIFSVVYIYRYHISGDGKLSIEEYMAEMEQAEIAKAATMASAEESINENNVKYLVDAVSLEKGAGIFKMSCGTCHGQLGEGGAGPNLTDEYWIHGGSIQDIFSTIKYGVPAKGMIPWESQLSPSQIQEVSSFVLSLKGSKPPNAKDPQGELYVPKEEKVSTTNDSLQLMQ